VSWRIARALVELRSEIDTRWPNRERSSDGSIGDLSHSARKSDHNPNASGVVRAIDVDADGIPADWRAEHVRRRGDGGDRRITPGGYVIFNRRIASDVGGWRWRVYTGSNPHTAHVHVSAATGPAGYDASGGWDVTTAKVDSRSKKKSGLPRFRRGSRLLRLTTPCMRGTDVRYLQRRVGADPDGEFGEKTEARVKAWQTAKGLEPDGRVGSATWASLRVRT
jgi:peptidoglycan hydrolase-like protein with peptidoglycan-binding domain